MPWRASMTCSSRLPQLYRDGELVRDILELPALQLEIARRGRARSPARALVRPVARSRRSRAARRAARFRAGAVAGTRGIPRAGSHALRDALLDEGAVTRSVARGLRRARTPPNIRRRSKRRSRCADSELGRCSLRHAAGVRRKPGAPPIQPRAAGAAASSRCQQFTSCSAVSTNARRFPARRAAGRTGERSRDRQPDHRRRRSFSWHNLPARRPALDSRQRRRFGRSAGSKIGT